MFIGFWRGVFFSIIIIVETIKKRTKIIGFWRGVFFSIIIIVETINFNQDSWDLSLKQPLIFLSITLLPSTLLAFNQKSFFKYKEKRSLIFFCFFLLTYVFLVDSLWIFFIFFELSVIPILLIISSQGGSKNRLEARKFLFIFTRGSSLILLFFLLWRERRKSWETLGWLSYPFEKRNSRFSFLFSILVLLTFFVKMPSLFLHIWLPKAHVEAPVFGSIILARVMLKMGGYGILLFRPLLDYFFSSFFTPFAFFLFSAYSALVCFNQKDLKILIAYSRVNHIALVLLAAIVGWRFGVVGGVFLILGHGVVSSILFFLRRVSYNRTSRRSLLILSRRRKDYFIISIWVFFTFINMGFPPFVNFLGEVYIIKMITFRPYFFFIGFLNFFLVGLYGVLMVSSITQRKMQKYSLKNRGGGLREFSVLIVVSTHLYCFRLINLLKIHIYV